MAFFILAFSQMAIFNSGVLSDGYFWFWRFVRWLFLFWHIVIWLIIKWLLIRGALLEASRKYEQLSSTDLPKLILVYKAENLYSQVENLFLSNDFHSYFEFRLLLRKWWIIKNFYSNFNHLMANQGNLEWNHLYSIVFFRPISCFW